VSSLVFYRGRKKKKKKRKDNEWPCTPQEAMVMILYFIVMDEKRLVFPRNAVIVSRLVFQRNE
jgi:hypothetical protein